MVTNLKKKHVLYYRRGFTLIELISTVALVGLAVPALAYLFNVAFLSSADSITTSQAHYLANALMNEISERRFKESDAFPGNIPENGEVSDYDRRGFNDIDDYNQFKLVWTPLSPPRDETGASMAAYSQYSQYVSVINVANPASGFPSRSFAAVADGSTNFKLVTVTIASTKTGETVSIHKVFSIP